MMFSVNGNTAKARLGMSLKWLAPLIGVALLIPVQAAAQTRQCEAAINGAALGGPLFFVGDPITISLDVGAGDVTGALVGDPDPKDYLDIHRFIYQLDCDPPADPNNPVPFECNWAGNTVVFDPNSVVTDCTDTAFPTPALIDFGQPQVVTGAGGSPEIIFDPLNDESIRNFSNQTCNVSFNIVVTAVEGENTEKVIREFAGWADADADCDNGLSANAGIPVVFDLSTEIVRFRVTKDFTDNFSGPVDVYLRCNGGLPLEQSATIVDPDGGGAGFDYVDFTVRYIDSGEVDCEIWEEPVPGGYTASYTAAIEEGGAAGGISPPDNAANCEFTDVQTGQFSCEIRNEPMPVTITVTKEWIGDFEENGYVLDATADYTCYNVMTEPDGEPKSVFGSLTFSGQGASDVIDGVYAVPGGNSYCDVTEVNVDSIIEVDDSDCQDVPVEADASCTIYNTIFFEGIPTMSRTGLALLALLMLGVGMVGFRRFA